MTTVQATSRFAKLRPRKNMGHVLVEENQRERLQAAMIEACLRHGYLRTTTRELSALSGVGKEGTYRVFRSKEELFLEFLEQDHIKTVCTRVQWAEGDGNGSACPKGSIYGKAKAWTPLLDNPLEGYVYLRSNGGERKLPDLVAALNGQVDIALWGKVDSGPNHGIRSRPRCAGDEVHS